MSIVFLWYIRYLNKKIKVDFILGYNFFLSRILLLTFINIKDELKIKLFVVFNIEINTWTRYISLFLKSKKLYILYFKLYIFKINSLLLKLKRL